MKHLISSHSQTAKNKLFLASIAETIKDSSAVVPEYYYIPIRPCKIRKKTIKTIDFSSKALFDYLDSKKKMEQRRLDLETEKQKLFDKLKDVN